MSTRRSAWSCGGLLLMLTIALPTAAAEHRHGVAAGVAGPSAPQANAVLKRMAHFLAAQDSFSVTLRARYDVVQQDGQKVEFGDLRTITMRRPDRLHVDIRGSDGDTSAIYYDGSALIVYEKGEAVYAKAPTEPTLDGAVAHFIRGLGMRLPLAVLLVSDIDKELERRVTALSYVERSTLCPRPCHHLAGRTDSTDVQVWVADDAQPVPLEVVITYREEPGQPQYRAELSGWNFAPKVDDSVFAFVPPTGAKEIPFAVTLAPLAPNADDGSGKPR